MNPFWRGSMAKKSEHSKAEQGRQISRIYDLLQQHRDHVYGVRHTVNAQHAHVESILCASRNESADTCIKQAPTNEADAEPEYSSERSFKERTRDLLASIQNSLQCQCRALERSFKALNIYINDNLEIYRDPRDISIGYPVDIDFSKQWLYYKNCPDSEISNTTKEQVKAFEEKEKLLQQNIQKINLNIHELEKENDKLKSTIAKYEMKINTLEQSVESKTTEITELENQKTTLMENITTKDEKINNFAKELDREKLKELEEKEKMLQENIQKNNQKIHDLEKENDKLRSTIAEYEIEINTLKQSVESKTTKMTELENKNTTFKKSITTKDEKIKNYDKELDDLKRERDKLQEILCDKQENRQVQLFYHTRGDLMCKVIDGLKSLLVEKLMTDRNKIHFVDCVSEEDVDPNLPLFLMCVHTVRIGSDVGTALQKLKRNVTSNVCVLVIHYKDLHALPHLLSDRVLSSLDFQGLGGIYDIAFLSEKGIYSCEMNKTSVNGIVQFLTRHALQK